MKVRRARWRSGLKGWLDFTIYVGPWAARFTLDPRGPVGWFGNGSRWWSGWSRPADEPDY